ncbi:hypothetical protein FRC03_010572 [Tulasnella sp. 419]|nr:hypothetical protein FRC03_010572 [Tulasnella sp. 419]
MVKHFYQPLTPSSNLPPVLNCDNITMDDQDRVLLHFCGVGNILASYSNDPTLWERILDMRDWIWETLEDRFANKAEGVDDDVEDAVKDDSQQLRLLGMDDERATISLFGVTVCIRRPRQYEGPRSLPSSSSSSSSVEDLTVAEAEYAQYGVRPPRYSERSALLPQQPTLRSIRSEQPSCMQPMLIPTPNSFMFAQYPSYHSTSGRSSPSESITPSGSPPRRSSPTRGPPRSALCSSSKYGNNNGVFYSIWATLTGIKNSPNTPAASSPPKTVRFSIHNDVKEYTKADWEPTDYYEPDFSHLQRLAHPRCPQKFEVRIHIGNNPPMIVKPILVTPPPRSTRKNRRSSSSSSSSSSSDGSPPRRLSAQRRNDRYYGHLQASRPVLAVA